MTVRGSTPKDELGNVYNHLTVIARAPNSMFGEKSRIMWLCRCICGIEIVVYGGYLRSGQAKSCGCKLTRKKHRIVQKHGLAYHPLYKVWHRMITRCRNNENSYWYKNYAGRGISVCPEWTDNNTGLQQFISDMISGYVAGLTLDRIDNNQGYFKNNCRWVTHPEQVHNSRLTTRVKVPFTPTSLKAYRDAITTWNKK